MPTPGEHKTVQARILEYAEAIGWTIVSREEAEQRRGIGIVNREERMAKAGSLFFDDLLDANPSSSTDYAGTGREFVDHLRNPPSQKGYGGTGRGKFFDQGKARGWAFIFCIFRDTMAVYASLKGLIATNTAFLCRIKHVRVIS